MKKTKTTIFYTHTVAVKLFFNFDINTDIACQKKKYTLMSTATSVLTNLQQLCF